MYLYLVPKKLPSLFPGYLTLLADFNWGRTFHRLHRDTHLGTIVDTYLMQHYMQYLERLQKWVSTGRKGREVRTAKSRGLGFNTTLSFIEIFLFSIPLSRDRETIL